MRSRTLAAAALTAALALSGCSGGDPEPEFEPETSSAASTTKASEPTTEPSPTQPVEPTLPAAAKEPTKAGAEAFVRYYWEVVNYAQKTGDVTRLRSLGQDYCEGCSAGVSGIERIYERGGRITGGEYSVRQATVSTTPSGAFVVSVQTQVGRQVVRGAGALNETYPGGHAGLLIGVRYDQGAWTVSSLEPQ